ncbi:MAG TPA: LuxR C-terminal-related transcriptional regulator [Noviherbaspirillum sp.]|nr:LuxR C-terminal-related transcriptional regulator [Noviherbaspirillum sp.]
MGAPFMARERLIERIRQAEDAKLTLVQAPAGFGKTTLLRHIYDSYSADGWAIAWLTFDAGDNDLDRFMSCLGQAFFQANHSSQFGQSDTGDLLHAEAGEDFELANAIAAAPLPFMLILDEFEHLHNPATLSVIQQLLEMLGPRQKIVIGSRELPMLSVGRLRACQQMLELDAAQLRFSLEETRHFLCDKRNLGLDGQDVARLYEVTGGWAAALWLSSLALESNDNPKQYIRTFSGSNTVVASYLAEDVLSHRPKHVQDFILQTSILQKFCADSCNAITGRSDSAALLQELERSNMFMTALDEQHLWYSYHPLFSGFLRAQLGRQYPGLASSLHRRAALWYLEQERPIPAIDHAIASGDKALLFQLLDKNAETLFLQGRVRLLARWLDALDRASLAAYPKLVSVYAWVLIHINRSEEALTLLETVIDDAGASPISHPTYHALRTFSLVMLDRVEQTAPMWDDQHILGGAAREPLLRSMLMIGCAYYYATAGRYQEARVLLDQATREHSAVGPLFSVTLAGYMHGMLDLRQGHLRAAGARLRALIGDESQMRVRGTAPRMHAIMGVEPERPNRRYGADAGFASVYLAEVLYEMDALEESKRLLKLYLPLIKDAGIPDQLIASHIIYARILRAEGNVNDALQTLLELEQLGMQRNLPRIIDMARLEQARGAVLDGDLEAAKAMFSLVGAAPAWRHRDLQMIAEDIETPLLGAMRLQVHGGQAAATLPVLKEHLHEVQARGRARYALRVKALYALALHHAGQRNPALRTMKEALQDALNEGFIRIFKDEGQALLVLVSDMLNSMKDASSTENGALRFFVERILNPFKNGASAAAYYAGDSAVAAPRMPRPSAENELTGRELDVLTLLAKGYGNQAIAEKLFVSVTTVKTHLRNINLKLGAHTRTEAISVARKLSIIA